MSVSVPADHSLHANDSDALRYFRLRWHADTDRAAITAAAEGAVGAAGDFAAVDPVAVAADHGARVRTDPTIHDSVHGLLQVIDRRWMIRVPVALKAERRRFSIAHEIGHILLFDAVADHPDLVRELTSPALRTHVEQLCNLAAAAILMPAAAMRKEVARWPELADPAALPSIAERFWVSYEAAARRIAETDPSWTLVMWEYRTDHPRGTAWRTMRSQTSRNDLFIPDGLSSHLRLTPDLVTRAASTPGGYAAAERVRLDSPNLRALHHARAWRSRRRGQQQLDSHLALGAAEEGGRVFLLGRRS